MGCASSRDSPADSEEERLITERQHDLGFSRIPAQTLEAQIKREGVNGVLTQAQFNRLLSTINIPSPSASPDSAVAKFFDKLKSNEGLYPVNKLAIIGILLGSGTSSKKAELLFNHADVGASGRLERAELTSLFEDIAAVAIDLLPVLAHTEKDASLIQAYQRRLADNISYHSKLAVATLIHSDQYVTLETFTSSLTKSDIKRWLVPAELRQSMIKGSGSENVLSSIKTVYGKKASSKPFPNKTPASSVNTGEMNIELHDSKAGELKSKVSDQEPKQNLSPREGTDNKIAEEPKPAEAQEEAKNQAPETEQEVPDEERANS